ADDRDAGRRQARRAEQPGDGAEETAEQPSAGAVVAGPVAGRGVADHAGGRPWRRQTSYPTPWPCRAASGRAASRPRRPPRPTPGPEPPARPPGTSPSTSTEPYEDKGGDGGQLRV